MTRIEMIEKLVAWSMEEFSTLDLSDVDNAYRNLLEDYLAKCSDVEVQAMMEAAE